MKILLLLLLISRATCEIFSLSREFEVSGKAVSDELAYATYDKLDRQTGWNRLYVYTNINVTPLQQHQAAGFLEGYATYREIWNAFNNLIKYDFDGNPYAPTIIEDFLEKQIIFLDQMVLGNQNDPFWTYIGYYLAQVRYMHTGYMARIKK
jgi:hypothetical protein